MSRYRGQSIALLTQHGKERVIAPALETALGCRVQLVTGYDTDQLGTFTRDTSRPGTQLEAARRKARVGMELSGLPVGLASEGSFAADPWTGMFAWNVEMVILLDDRLGIEVVGVAQGAARSAQLQTADWAALEQYAQQQGFPGHQLVLRPDGPDDPRLDKGLADWAALRASFERCRAGAANGQVYAESDLRAHANPTRMQRIGEATRDLLQRLQTECPACHAPGYGLVGREPGLPCRDCGSPTQTYRAEVLQCPACKHREVRARSDRDFAEPGQCTACNP